MRKSCFVALSGILVAGLAWAAKAQKWNFDGDKAGTVPKGWSSVVGEWKVAVDDTAPSQGHVLAQTARNPNRVFNLAVAEGTRYQDCEITVRLKAVSGQLDRGGGPMWRYKDKGNYYLCRYNPLEENYRVYKVVNGKRRQLGTAEAIKTVPGWHELKAKMKGNHIECFYDGKKRLDVKDDTFKEAGKVGLWTKSDAVTNFDDFEVK